jgi:hypothetical protein
LVIWKPKKKSVSKKNKIGDVHEKVMRRRYDKVLLNSIELRINNSIKTTRKQNPIEDD